MNKPARLALGVLIAVGILLTTASPSLSDPASAAQANFVKCPPHLVAPYGGDDGWSSITVQANFVRAVMAPKGLMTCQYGFGKHPTPFFGIQKPCPPGFRCVAVRGGFRVLPIIK